MKQVLQYRRSGTTRVEDVPAPRVPRAGILVQNAWSLISPGTERMVVEAGGMNLLNTARERPDLVKRVVTMAQQEGVKSTFEKVRSRIDTAIPLGYSCAGTVIEADEQSGYKAGDRVACAGAGIANHAEVLGVPKNLAAHVPERVSLEDAAFATVGAIALHGVRIADVKLGETCAVIGLGLVGQLTVQLLKAAGCRVLGIDLDPEKVALARRIGADDAVLRTDDGLQERMKTLSVGRGADAVLITAASSSSDPVELAAQLARDRAVVAAVGLVGMNVPRNAYYEKELDLRISRSYGPGRYDATYETDGVDYPVGYVRWTEQRNMEAFLGLIAQGKVQPSALVTHRFPLEEAEQAYEIITGEQKQPYMGVLLQYATQPSLARKVGVPSSRGVIRPAPGVPRVGVIGAGSFAKGVLIPRLRDLKDEVSLTGVATGSGPNAQQTAERFGFRYAATDWQEVVADPETDAVVVATRHNLHARIVVAALRAGKSVFVEKPLALTEDEVGEVLEAWRGSGKVLLVGFNRRFSPHGRQARETFMDARTPLLMSYRVNAGSVAAGSWVIDPEEGGGRIVGEVCHMVDLMQFVCGSRVRTVFTQAARGRGMQDDVAVTLGFENGSAGSIVYASGGDRSQPKEHLEVLGGGKSVVIDDFVRLSVYARGAQKAHNLRTQDKGHAAELRAFLDAVRRGRPSPIDPEDAAHVTRVTLAAVESARAGLPVSLAED